MAMSAAMKRDLISAFNTMVDTAGVPFAHEDPDGVAQPAIIAHRVSPQKTDETIINALGLDTVILVCKNTTGLAIDKFHQVTEPTTGRVLVVQYIHPVPISDTLVGYRLYCL